MSSTAEDLIVSILGATPLDDDTPPAGDGQPVWPVAALTGHRSLPTDGWIAAELSRIATKLSTVHRTTTAITGLAVGVDQLWADTAAAAGLTLWGYSPGSWQPDRWTPAQATRRRSILTTCSKVIELPGTYHVSRLHERNQLMVNDCDVLIAVVDPTRPPGGTHACYQAAIAAGRPIIRVDPTVQRTVFVAAAPRP